MEADSRKDYVRDGLTWCSIISLPYHRNKNGDYIVERIGPQPRLLQVFRDLPVCTGVVGIKEFYFSISGETVVLNGFLDLSRMAAAAGYKLRARNMTALGSGNCSKQKCFYWR